MEHGQDSEPARAAAEHEDNAIPVAEGGVTRLVRIRFGRTPNLTTFTTG